MERRKVFIVGPTESILTKRGNRHPALAKYLVEQHYPLEYVTSNFYHAEKRWFGRDEVKEAQGKVPYALTVLNCLGYRNNVSLRRIISNALLAARVFIHLLPRLGRDTILILPSRPVEMILCAAMLRLLRGTSVALDIQDVWPDMLVGGSRLKLACFTLYCNLYLYPSLRNINKFFHVAPSFVDWLARYSPGAKSTFIPLGYDAARWSAIRPDTAPSSRKDKPISLVCVGLLQRQIDVMPLLEVLVGNPDFELTLIGDNGEGERYPEVTAFIAEKGMQNVNIVGRVEPERMGDFLAGMDVGVVPMLSSSIPNKVFDYIAAYLPILVLGQNDSAHLVEEHSIGWSTPAYTSQSAAETMKRITREAMAEKRKNIARVRPEWDRRVLFEKVVELIESKS